MTVSSEWSEQPVVAPVVIIIGGGGSGLFVYSPTAGAGNLIASIAGAAGTDQYGNTYPQGVFEQDPAGSAAMLSGGALYVDTAGNLSTGSGSVRAPAIHQLALSSGRTGVGQLAALMQFSAVTLPATSGTILTDTLTAWDPTATVHTTAETWHSLGTLAGYTVTAGRYRLTPEGEVELDIDVLPGGANASTTAFSNTLPAAYRPPTSRPFPVAYNRNVTAGDTWPHIQVTSAGVVNVVVQANIGTQISCNQRYPLS